MAMSGSGVLWEAGTLHPRSSAPSGFWWGMPAAPQGEGISLVRRSGQWEGGGGFRVQWREPKGEPQPLCWEAQGEWRGEGARLLPFGTQGRAEDKSGASRQGTCLGTEPGARKVTGTLRFSGDCSVCVCIWPQLVTQAGYLWGQAGSLLRLPAVCQWRPLSPILARCIGWSCYSNWGKNIQTCLTLEKLWEKHSVVGLWTAPLLVCICNKNAFFYPLSLKYPLAPWVLTDFFLPIIFTFFPPVSNCSSAARTCSACFELVGVSFINNILYRWPKGAKC